MERLISYALCLLCLTLGSCTGDPLFGPVGSNFAAPISIALDPANNRAYVVNSNINLAFTEGNFFVLDLTDPINPVALDNPDNPVLLTSLSGPIVFDSNSQQVFVTNRFSDDKTDTVDTLFTIDVDEAADFGSLTEFASGKDPFGIACCDANDQIYVVSSGTLEIYSRTDPSQRISRSLEVFLSSGVLFSGISTTQITLLGNQAFLSNRAGIIYVLNLDKVSDSALNPIDYLITGMEDLRGIATDGTNLYVVEADFEDENISRLRVIDLTVVPAIAENFATVTEIEIDSEQDVGGTMTLVEKTTVALGADANEILLFNNKAYITNSEDNTVSAIDITDPENVAAETTITVGEKPFGMAADTFGISELLYITNLDSDDISIVDLATNTVVGSFP